MVIEMTVVIFLFARTDHETTSFSKTNSPMLCVLPKHFTSHLPLAAKNCAETQFNTRNSSDDDGMSALDTLLPHQKDESASCIQASVALGMCATNLAEWRNIFEKFI